MDDNFKQVMRQWVNTGTEQAHLGRIADETARLLNALLAFSVDGE